MVSDTAALVSAYAFVYSFAMDILSKDTLTLLRDADLRKAVEEVLTSEDSASSTKTVTVQKIESSSSAPRQEPTEVTIRRVST